MKQKKRNVIRKEPEWIRRAKIIISFPHVWVCVVLAVAAGAMLYSSWRLDTCQKFWSSVCANIFAGLVTGLAVCLIGGAKQISIARMQVKKEWLQHLADLIKIYLGDYHQMIRKKFDRFDGKIHSFDFYYDMSIHAGDITVEIHQGIFNKALSFDPDKYCRKSFGYDSVAMGEKFDALHSYVEMIEIDCPGSKEIAKQFEAVHTELRKLNSAVHCAIRELNVKLAEMGRSIV